MDVFVSVTSLVSVERDYIPVGGEDFQGCGSFGHRRLGM
jgi:hypothetical protein